MTNRFGFDLSTVVADSFQNLLDLGQETLRIVDVSKMSQDRTWGAFTYRYDRPELQARCARNVPGTLFGLPHKSHSSIGDQSFPNEDH